MFLSHVHTFYCGRPISSFPPLTVRLTPTAQNVSKSSRFPSLSSWRRRNFLGKRFTFLASEEVLQPKPGCFVLSFYILLLIQQPPDKAGGSIGAARILPPPPASLLKRHGTLPGTFARRLSNFSPREERSITPFQNLILGERSGRWCGWILEISARQQLQLPDPTNKTRKRRSDTGFCQNKHVGDNVSQLALLSDSPPRLISHLSHSGISWTEHANSSIEAITPKIQNTEAWMNESAQQIVTNSNNWKK